MNQDLKKQNSAKEAFNLIRPDLQKDSVIGIGTGSTTNFFIEELNKANIHIKGVVCSSNASEKLIINSYEKFSLNNVHSIDFYIDGADEFNDRRELIKGGGGALTREKILAHNSEKFICIVDESKKVDILGKFPLPVEVIPLAQSAIALEFIRMGGRPVLREGFTTDNGNVILDVHNLEITEPLSLETKINNIPGVITNGIFAFNHAHLLLSAGDNQVVRTEPIV